MGLTWKERWELIKLLRIDVFMMLFSVSFSISGVSLNQLVEDKVCLNNLKLNQSICLNLEHIIGTQESDKNYILATAAVFKNYQTILFTLPGIFLSLFIGYWIDNYPGHLRFILAAPALGGTIGSIIIIYNCLHFELDFMYLLTADILRGICGGFATIYTGIYTYIARKTPAKFRALRFAILEFFSFIATPVSLYLGGFVLTTQPWFNNQPRNYIGVFLISAICSAISLIWVMIFVNDAGSNESPLSEYDETKVTDEETSSTCPVVDHEAIDQHDGVISHTYQKPPSKGCCGDFANTFVDIFNSTNVINMFRTCTKKRQKGLRCRIWHCISMCTFVLLAYMGDASIGFPFAQKVYHWDAKYYSNISSIIIAIPSLATTIAAPILVKRFGLTDTGLGILGCISMIASMTIRGGFLTPTAYFVANVAGMFAGLMPIALRSMLSRMISFDEIGQVYSLLSAVESCAPAISSLFYSTIFKLTISTLPGLVYQLAAFLLFYPFVTTLWLDLTKASWYDVNKKPPTNHSEEGDQNESEIPQTSLHNKSSLNTIDSDLEQLIES